MENVIAGTTCSQCSTSLNEVDNFCPTCGFPERGSQEEKSKYLLRISSRKRLLEDSHAKIKSAKKVLYIIGGANLIVGVIMGAVNDDMATIISSLIFGGLYVVLALWCNQQPFSAILTGFVVYISLILILAFLDPISLFSGIILKIIFIAILIKGIISAKEAQRLLNELKGIELDGNYHRN